MYKTFILKCDKCGAILIVPNSQYYGHEIICNNCNQPMRKLDEDFDLTEIIEEDE